MKKQDVGLEVDGENESPLRMFGLQKTGYIRALCSRQPVTSHGQNFTLRVHMRKTYTQQRVFRGCVCTRKYPELLGNLRDTEIRLISGKRAAKNPSLGCGDTRLNYSRSFCKNRTGENKTEVEEIKVLGPPPLASTLACWSWLRYRKQGGQSHWE